jgi:hypothetical protein
MTLTLTLTLPLPLPLPHPTTPTPTPTPNLDGEEVHDPSELFEVDHAVTVDVTLLEELLQLVHLVSSRE